MPPYAFLARAELNTRSAPDHLRANRTVGVPYSDDMIANAEADIRAQVDPMNSFDFEDRYPGALVRDFDDNPQHLTEMDALIAYLQMLGAGVDFSTYQAEAPENQR